MTKTSYGIGDKVFLLAGPIRNARAEGEYTIVGQLPEAEGMSQYRVKSISENFERRIVATDIDTERSRKPRGGEQPSPVRAQPKESWLKPSAVRIGK